MALIRHCCTQLWLCRVCDKICLNQIFLIINILSTDDDVVGSNCCNIVNIICQCINPCITSNNTNNFLLLLLVTWTWSLPWWSWWQYLCSGLWSATVSCPSQSYSMMSCCNHYATGSCTCLHSIIIWDTCL